jgi:hypothetical protein
VECALERSGEAGRLQGWVRDGRVSLDVRVDAQQLALVVKRPLERLYSRQIIGGPLMLSEVVGSYSGLSGTDRGLLVVRDSALSTDPVLQSVVFRRQSDQSMDSFTDLTLDSQRGLLIMVQFDHGLPSRKWVLAFRREDIDYEPWFLGTGFNLRTPMAYDLSFEKQEWRPVK